MTVGTGGETLIVEEWPASTAEGAVDIALRKGLEEVVLGEGFSYWDFSGGSMPPRITSVQPSEANPAGGTDLRIRGTGFVQGASVEFISYDAEGAELRVPATEGLLFIELEDGVQEIEVVTPAHDADGDGNLDNGWTDLVVTNPSGIATDPGYPYLFTGDAAAPVNPGDQTGRNGGCSVLASEGQASLAILFGMLALALRSRREGVLR